MTKFQDNARKKSTTILIAMQYDWKWQRSRDEKLSQSSKTNMRNAFRKDLTPGREAMSSRRRGGRGSLSLFIYCCDIHAVLNLMLPMASILCQPPPEGHPPNAADLLSSSDSHFHLTMIVDNILLSFYFFNSSAKTVGGAGAK